LGPPLPVLYQVALVLPALLLLLFVKGLLLLVELTPFLLFVEEVLGFLFLGLLFPKELGLLVD